MDVYYMLLSKLDQSRYAIRNENLNSNFGDFSCYRIFRLMKCKWVPLKENRRFHC